VLSCSANGAVSIPASTSFTVTVDVTPTAIGSLANTATVDPNNVIPESDETHNTGANTVTVSAGSGSASGHVYFDTNGNGSLDTGEAGIPVAVTLKIYADDGTGKPTGTAVATVQSDPTTGLYTFTSIPAGDYVIVETDPSGYKSTADTQGSLTDNFIAVTITAGGSATGNDFLDTYAGGISGVAWVDANTDGTHQAGETTFVTGAKIELFTDPNGDGDPSDGTLYSSTTTDTSGAYSFPLLPVGHYVVIETDQPGFTSTTLNHVAANITAAAPSATVDFGDLPVVSSIGSGTIKGVVINDANNNGTQDAGEQPLRNATVTLYDSGGNMVGTIPSGADGTYQFTNLAPGAYRVVQTPPAGYTRTSLGTVRVFLAGAQTAQVDFLDATSTLATIIDPAVTKHGSPESAGVGDEVIYTITVGNNGNANATGVVLTDTKPAFLDILRILIDPNPGNTLAAVISGNTFTINFGTITPATVYTVTVITRVNSLGQAPGGSNAVALTATSDPTTDRVVNNSSSAMLVVHSTTSGTASELPGTGFAPDRVTALPSQPASLAYANSDLVLEVPALKISIPIMGVPLGKKTWDITWLGSRAGYLEGTAFPTLPGNSVLTGHVYMANGKPGPFLGLDQLQWGDEITIRAFGSRYTYSLRSVEQVSPNNLSPLKHKDGTWITLLTCKGYNEATGTYSNRIAVQAVLVKVENIQK
jgi:LPXTG-site transpeptidase (sortase) family protein